MRVLRTIALLPVLVVAWMFADLYLRVNLPGAELLQHLAFRIAATVFHWLDADHARAKVLIGAWAAGGLIAAAVGSRGAWFWRFSAPALAAVEVAVVVVAALMERALFAGIVVALLVAARRGAFRDDRPDPTDSEPVPRRKLLLSVGAGLAALAYVAGAFAAQSGGYGLLERLRDLMGSSGPSLLTLTLVGLGLLGAAGAWIARRSLPTLARARIVRPLGLATLVGCLTTLAVVPLLDRGLPLVSIPVVIAAALGLALPVVRATHREVTSRPMDPLVWPLALLLPVLLAATLFAHTYAARIFGCDRVEESAVLTRVADAREIFGLELNASGATAAMTLRARRSFGYLDLQPPGDLTIAHPGPVPRAATDDPTALAGSTYATPEELEYAPGLDSFFATTLAGHTDYYSMETSPPSTVNNRVVTLSGDGRAVTEAWGESHLCWIGSLTWDDRDGLLYLGCEYDSELHRWDPRTKSLRDATRDPRLGDVAGVAFDGDRLYTVSLWNSRRLSELDRDTLEYRRSVPVGGTHYGLVLHPGEDGGTLFVPSFYASRVRTIRTGSLAAGPSIPTGLGTRPVALAEAGDRDLLLVASLYDGLLRVCDADQPSVLRRVFVGGHVKDIAVDRERGLAYFWSQCGLFRLDLEALLASEAN